MDNYKTYYYKYIRIKKKYILLKYNKMKGGGDSNIISYFDNRLIYNKLTKRTIYFNDIKKKWKLYTNKEGFYLLYNLYIILKIFVTSSPNDAWWVNI